MSTASKKTSEESLSVTIDNPQHLTELCGYNDKHLAIVEQETDVLINPHGNRLFINGSPSSCLVAQAVFNELMQRLERGLSVEEDDVLAAIRLATNGGGAELITTSSDRYLVNTRNKTISPRSPQQAKYIDALKKHDMVFGIGPAGTGKTYLAAAFGISLLLKKQVERLILSRPAVEAGERLGFLPGDMKEKVDPYLRPLYDALHDFIPKDQVTRKLDAGEIEVAPLAFMRGRTLSKAFVILDEAQNTTPMQMKMFLTRLGEHSKMVVTGDPTQIDLPQTAGERRPRSGLVEAVGLLEGVKGVAFTRFTDKDVVRHPLVSRIVKAYERQDGAS